MARRRGQTSGEYASAATGLAEGVARICRLYGVSPLLGRIYAELFLAVEPLSLEALCERVGAAKSTVSVALRKLLAARVVRRLPARGDRRDYYEAATDPWAILADWARLFMQPEVAMWRETGGALRAALASADDAPRGAHRAEVRRRLEQIEGFLGVFERALDGMTKQRPAPPPARSVRITLRGGEP